MSKKVILGFVAGILMLGLMVAGCAETPTGPTGSLLDEVIWTVESDPAAAVSKLSAGDIDAYAFPISNPDIFESILADPNIDYEFNYGGYRDLRFNTYGPVFTEGENAGQLNPFFVPAIREAFNWLIDRDYMVDEYLGGMGAPKYTALGTAFPDHLVRYTHIVDAIEEYYAHDPEKAASIITEEMENLGCELINGTWHYEGEELVIRMLIRADLPPFPSGGQYIADLVEDLGFAVDRMVLVGSEASPIWIGSHPNLGLMHIYTGGWSSPTIPRDSGGIFDQMYTHRVMMGFALWDILGEQLEDWPELSEASRRLRQKEFSTMAEREQLFETVLWESLKFSNCLWLMDIAGANPYRSDVRVAVDVAGGIGDPAWVYTTHKVDADGNPAEGGIMRIESSNMLTDPWNPVAGSSWTYDMYITRRAVGDTGLVVDPRDGLVWPHRIERAEVYIVEGLPVGITHDWLTLEFVDEIQVPLDAWSDWDAANQQWLTVEDRFGAGGVTAQRKSVVYFQEDLYDVPLHDGSTFSIGDVILAMIVDFDRAKPESAIFDQAVVASHEAGMGSFRGIKIVSEDPLIVEYYTDLWYMDAELNVYDAFPTYGTYAWSGQWHTVTLGILAEQERALAFTKSKADELQVEWMDYTKGPSLPILKTQLDKAVAENFIPYEPTLGNYITEAEASDRWGNMLDFYEEWGHFWVGAGPYIISDVRPVEKIVVLVPFQDYPDAADKFFFFLDPLVE